MIKINIVMSAQEGLCNRLCRLRGYDYLRSSLGCEITAWWPRWKKEDSKSSELFKCKKSNLKIKDFVVCSKSSRPIPSKEGEIVITEPFNVKNTPPPKQLDLFDIIWPTEEILKTASIFYNKYMNKGPVVGIHARKFCRHTSTSFRNLEWFEEKIVSENIYFVSTDRPDFYNRIKKTCPNSTFIRNAKDYESRKDMISPEGLKEAFVDLLLLGSCESLIKNPGSTFSSTARDIQVGINPVLDASNDQPRL